VITKAGMYHFIESKPVVNCNAAKTRNPSIGAMTVEYAIIFPFVILIVMLLIYFGMIYYQQALLQSVVSKNTQDWAFLWGYDAQKIQPGEGILSREGYDSEGLYWQVFSGAKQKKVIICNAIVKEYSTKSLLRTKKDIQVEVLYENYLILHKVGVKAVAEYPMPMKGLFRAVGLSGNITLQARSETTVHDPKEFIQNVDLLLQIYEESGAKEWVMEKCKPLTDSLKKMKNYFK